jgi:hypothetical protein
MPFPWDEDNPQVRNRIMDNLAVLLPDVVASGRRRDQPSMDLVRDWHRRMLDGVPLVEPAVAGGFRGSGPQGGELKTYRVAVDQVEAVRPGRVRSQMSLFERRIGERVTALDPLIPPKAPRSGASTRSSRCAPGRTASASASTHSPTATAVWREPCFCGLGPATACPPSSTFAHGRAAQPATRTHRELP